MKRVTTVLVGAAAVAALAAGCASSTTTSSTPSPSPSGTAPASASPAAHGGAVLKTASSPEGQILVDGSGRTLYLFQADTGPSSTCDGACAVAWPPDTTTGAPSGTGLNTALIGTSVRADHATQVTYKGHPLYYFADDAKPGQTNGQGVDAFGGRWYVVGPSGAAITAAPAAPTPSPSTGGGYGY